MLSSSEERVLEQILENLNQGIVYVDQERKIRLCNKKAKEITGIAFGAHDSHEAGRIADGDVCLLYTSHSAAGRPHPTGGAGRTETPTAAHKGTVIDDRKHFTPQHGGTAL